MLNKRFGNIKGAVSDLHRDVTTRRCLTSYERVEDIVRECATIKTDLDRADTMMDDHKVEFEKRWQQEQLRIKTEQAVFNDQVFSFCLRIKAYLTFFSVRPTLPVLLKPNFLTTTARQLIELFAKNV